MWRHQTSQRCPKHSPMCSGSNSPMVLVVMMYDQTGRQWKLKIQDDGYQTGTFSIFATGVHGNVMSTPLPCFGIQNFSEINGNVIRPNRKESELENPRWLPQNRNSCVPDSNAVRIWKSKTVASKPEKQVSQHPDYIATLFERLAIPMLSEFSER